MKNLGEVLGQIKKYFFSHARTALKYGLANLGLQEGDGILLPDYICDVITHPLKRMKLKKQYYPITDDFNPIWTKLENLVNKNTKAIIMVHYFGQPQNIQLFFDFCKKYNIFLIEDNAHGYGGFLNNQLLGTFGDIGISSPRKILNICSGGVLWLKDKKLDKDPNISKYPVSLKDRFKRKSNYIPYKLKNFIISKIKSRPKYEDYNAFHETEIEEYLIDDFSFKFLNNSNLEKVRNNQQSIYLQHEKFAINNNLTPAIKKLHPESCPWFFPAYVHDNLDAVEWFKWGWENNIKIFSWPSLPKQIIAKNGNAMERWKKLICFGIN